ncbi:restriction endonuclease subunit S [Pseudomonas sp. Pseusp122]|uniref:restriction endonuclease subunit S n=1 Tax=unclassified Pseudomonas TaxID=196821 RepID=UPI0039A52FC0
MTFPAYPDYRDSGVEWLGVVPEHWGVKPLRYLGRFRKGLTITKADLTDTGIPCLNYGEVHSLYPFEVNQDIQALKCVPAEYLETEPSSYISYGDFVFADTSEDLEGVGNFTHVSGLEPLFAGYHTIIYSLDSDVSSRFLAYCLESFAFRTQLRMGVKGVKVFSVTQEILRGGIAWIPTTAEQTQIARFLDHETTRIDALIEEQQRLIELLKEKRQAVISHAVTKGIDPTVPMKDSGVEWLGEVPAHWELTRVGWQCIVGNGCTPARDNQGYWDDGHYPWLNSSKVNLERVDEADQFVTSQALKECALPIVKPGSVLMAITGEGKTRGMVTITEIEATINQHVAFIEPRGSELLPTFLHDWLKANYCRLRHDSADWGSTKAAITCSDIRAYPLPLPPLAEQVAICQFVDSKSSLLDELIFSADENVSLLYERRSALISAAVTGKIDVRGWQPPARAQAPVLQAEAV